MIDCIAGNKPPFFYPQLLPELFTIRNSPNIQTSLAEVKRLKLMDSGAIHLIGNRVTEAVM